MGMEIYEFAKQFDVIVVFMLFSMMIGYYGKGFNDRLVDCWFDRWHNRK